jgi:hypothetical protein
MLLLNETTTENDMKYYTTNYEISESLKRIEGITEEWMPNFIKVFTIAKKMSGNAKLSVQNDETGTSRYVYIKNGRYQKLAIRYSDHNPGRTHSHGAQEYHVTTKRYLTESEIADLKSEIESFLR